MLPTKEMGQAPAIWEARHSDDETKTPKKKHTSKTKKSAEPVPSTSNAVDRDVLRSDTDKRSVPAASSDSSQQVNCLSTYCRQVTRLI